MCVTSLGTCSLSLFELKVEPVFEYSEIVSVRKIKSAVGRVPILK